MRTYLRMRMHMRVPHAHTHVHGSAFAEEVTVRGLEQNLDRGEQVLSVKWCGDDTSWW